MDTRSKTPEQVEQALRIIKTRMPNVYQSIQSKATSIGPKAYQLVRKGVRGEAGCFYAFEAGHVVGTPFSERGVDPDVAALMCEFGCDFLCMWAADAVSETQSEALEAGVAQ